MDQPVSMLSRFIQFILIWDQVIYVWKHKSLNKYLKSDFRITAVRTFKRKVVHEVKSVDKKYSSSCSSSSSTILGPSISFYHCLSLDALTAWYIENSVQVQKFSHHAILDLPSALDPRLCLARSPSPDSPLLFSTHVQSMSAFLCGFLSSCFLIHPSLNYITQ